MICPVSPITHLNNTALVRSVDSKYLIEGYKKYLNIDVARFFTNEQVQIFKCNDTGYLFYNNPLLSGDALFYKELQRLPWYNQDWKFEFEVAAKQIYPKDKVLEIGCGKGAFLKYLTGKGVHALGLELNDEVAERSQGTEITILNETIEAHADKNEGVYDWVISFQVLEHIYDVQSFIQASVKALKKGGKLLIAVPNNDAIFFNYTHSLIINYDSHQLALIMNMPPHHMGMWNKSSLKKLSGFFDLHLKFIEKEPLPMYRTGMVSEILTRKFIPFRSGKIYHQANRLIFKIIRKVRVLFSGDTIVAVYSKS